MPKAGPDRLTGGFIFQANIDNRCLALLSQGIAIKKETDCVSCDAGVSLEHCWWDAYFAKEN